ncbi:MAG TPA: DUF3828 domain-containing protein [Thermodesulfobacteriota bacterium]
MRVLSFSTVLLISCCFYACSKEEPEQTVNKFYRVYLRINSHGIPTEQEQALYSPYISPELSELLKRANEAEQKYKTATKGEVPPLVESDLFTSLFEGASSFKTISCDSKEGSGSCLVEFKYFNPGDSSEFKWKDRVYLVKINRGWVVDDIEYLGDWQFMHKGRLKDLLKEVIEDGNSN